MCATNSLACAVLSPDPNVTAMWVGTTELHGLLLKKDGERTSGKSPSILFLMNFIKGKGNLPYYANICNSNFIMFVNL